MPRHDDHRSAGRSKISPYIEGECPQDRHARRRSEADSRRDELKKALNEIGWEIVIKNHGCHWIITKGKNKVEWWPNTAKMVINQKWSNGIHVHDTDQVLKVIKRKFQKRGQHAKK